MADVAFVLHGHFYQPPRENPWTEAVPRQPSAAPFHDWNERITAECYRPNGWPASSTTTAASSPSSTTTGGCRSTSGRRCCRGSRTTPEVYSRIIEADRAGHRGIAQAYGHAILPLCNDQDLRTQVRWGLADFRHRFGREPEGMWLPETAVDERVLAVLAEEGVRFTILAPGQVVPDGTEEGGHVPLAASRDDPGRASTWSSTTVRSATTWPSAASPARWWWTGS